MPPVTWQALQTQGLGAKITDSCVRLPPFGGHGEFFTENETTHEMVSDENPEAFWKAARTATRIIHYDPNAPYDPRASLPWPYHRMTCNDVSSGDVPELPEGMAEIVISRQYREAMARALTADDLRTHAIADRSDKPSPEWVGQVLITPPRPENFTKAIREVGQMFRDAARGVLPTVKREGAGPDDEDISIIDTKTGQIVGGLGAGFAIGAVPGGTFIAQDTMAAGDKPTREFIMAEGLGEMLSGGVQFTVGTGMGAGGAGLSLTGGGALLGVPTCAAGIALAANGAATFINGGQKVIVALCHWEELREAPSAATAESAATSSTAGTPSTSTNSGPPAGTAAGGSAAKPAAPAAAAKPAPTPAPVKPAPTPTAAKPALPAKPTPAPVKPAPVPEAPPTGTTIVYKSASGSTTTSTRRRLAPGEKPPQETTTITITEGGGTTTTVTRPRVEPAELKPYGGTGGGHHVPAKKAFEGAPGYDLKKALAIPNAELDRLGIDHIGKLTPAQRRGYTEFADTGKALTWEAVAKIETEALVSAGMKLDMAESTVGKAIQALKDAGVPAPTRIPWGKR